ncbi:MAG: FtsP/CotA-like multicopper oxidase with cupredoxin domain, partial [Verrucomicrobiales bacterium]
MTSESGLTMTPDSQDTRPKKNPNRILRPDVVAIGSLLAFGVITWQHFVHTTLVSVGGDGILGHMSHVLRDSMLALPLMIFAVHLGLSLASKAGVKSGAPAEKLQQASFIGLVVMLVMIPASVMHGKIEALLGGHAHAAEGSPIIHSLRDALLGQLFVIPLAYFGLMAAAWWLAGAKSDRRHHLASIPWISAALITLSTVVLVSTPGVGLILLVAFIIGMPQKSTNWVGRLVVVAMFVGAIIIAPTAPGGEGEAEALGAEAGPCELGAPQRSYDVTAIEVDITFNRFGDHDPDSSMYVLDQNIAAVRAQEATGQVTGGLRTDPIQALVLRANLGDCLTINFTNDLPETASFNVQGLPFSASNAGGEVGFNSGSFAPQNGGSISYQYQLPSDQNAERAYTFASHGDSRQLMAHGLFGTLVLEPAGSTYLHPETSVPINSGWEAIIVDPLGVDFREFIIAYHEIGDETFNVLDRNDEELPVLDAISGSYRPGSRAINYRSEPFRNRLGMVNEKSLAYSSYTHGDPATPIPRSYLGEPTKTRLVQPGSEMFHVHHLHGGANRWRTNPGVEPDELIGGLKKIPTQYAFSDRNDSQSVGPGESYNLEHECGAGGCQQASGDFLYHCHIGHHYVSGMWGLWRVFDTVQPDLAVMPPDVGYVAPPVPIAVDSIDLIGSSAEGKTLVPRILLADPSTELALEDYIEAQLPPQGVRIDSQDATVWDWILEYVDGDLTQPLYKGEPEDTTVWENFESPTPGVRPSILFNPGNARTTWPLLRPHLGQRPPFSPNGHSGAPWLGEDATPTRPDGLCPGTDLIPGRRLLEYPITAIDIPIQVSTDPILGLDPDGKVFVLSEDIDDVRNGIKSAQPLALRSNVGDCVNVTLTSQQEDVNHAGHAKVNMHTHFVQFDPRGSDGVITGFAYEQSIRPYATENRTLVDPVGPGDIEIEVTNVDRLRIGIFIGVGLGEGMCDTATGLPAANPDNDDRACIEIRRIVNIVGNVITLDEPLENVHAIDEAVGVEFVQYRWYSDVDSGTVFWHDHVNFKNWDHGLFGAHVIEPAGSTYHDPETGAEVRSGPIVDVHAPADASVGEGQHGSFREMVVFLHNGSPATPNERAGSTINLRSDPLGTRDPNFPFSSVTNGDPITPLLRAYLGDPVVFRGLGLVERVGSLRVTGHRFAKERTADEGAIYD